MKQLFVLIMTMCVVNQLYRFNFYFTIVLCNFIKFHISNTALGTLILDNELKYSDLSGFFIYRRQMTGSFIL